jgi:hypothetical protein
MLMTWTLMSVARICRIAASRSVGRARAVGPSVIKSDAIFRRRFSEEIN